MCSNFRAGPYTATSSFGFLVVKTKRKQSSWDMAPPVYDFRSCETFPRMILATGSPFVTANGSYAASDG